MLNLSNKILSPFVFPFFLLSSPFSSIVFIFYFPLIIYCCSFIYHSPFTISSSLLTFSTSFSFSCYLFLPPSPFYSLPSSCYLFLFPLPSIQYLHKCVNFFGFFFTFFHFFFLIVYIFYFKYFIYNLFHRLAAFS